MTFIVFLYYGPYSSWKSLTKRVPTAGLWVYAWLFSREYVHMYVFPHPREQSIRSLYMRNEGLQKKIKTSFILWLKNLRKENAIDL